MDAKVQMGEITAVGVRIGRADHPEFVALSNNLAGTNADQRPEMPVERAEPRARGIHMLVHDQAAPRFAAEVHAAHDAIADGDHGFMIAAPGAVIADMIFATEGATPVRADEDAITLAVGIAVVAHRRDQRARGGHGYGGGGGCRFR